MEGFKKAVFINVDDDATSKEDWNGSPIGAACIIFPGMPPMLTLTKDAFTCRLCNDNTSHVLSGEFNVANLRNHARTNGYKNRLDAARIGVIEYFNLTEDQRDVVDVNTAKKPTLKPNSSKKRKKDRVGNESNSPLST